MFNRKKLIEIMEKNDVTAYKLWKLSGVAQSTISDILNKDDKNPTTKTLQKMANALNVPIDEFFKEETSDEVEMFKEDPDLYEIEDKIKYAEALIDFAEPENALKFILAQPSMQDFGGYDLKNMSDEEILEIANDMLFAMRLSLEKMKKKNK
jgi:transcriptional regulator with XRE-family HTH domain